MYGNAMNRGMSKISAMAEDSSVLIESKEWPFSDQKDDIFPRNERAKCGDGTDTRDVLYQGSRCKVVIQARIFHFPYFTGGFGLLQIDFVALMSGG